MTFFKRQTTLDKLQALRAELSPDGEINAAYWALSGVIADHCTGMDSRKDYFRATQAAIRAERGRS